MSGGSAFFCEVSPTRKKELHVYRNVEGYISNLSSLVQELWMMVMTLSKELPDLAKLISADIEHRMTFISEGYSFVEKGD